MNLNVPVELHNAFKSVTAAQGQNMTDVLLEFIKTYVAKHSTQGAAQVKRAALYLRVSTVDQHPETQLYDLRQMAAQRGYEIVQEYTDRISGAKARRPGLDELMRDARRGRFDVVLVWAWDRIARSIRHFLEVLDELNRLGHRVRQLPRADRHRRPAGPRHRGDHRRHRGTGTQPDRRAGPRRHAARPSRRPADRKKTA